jgi:ADP-heptose:LPS heptosyltransferase
MDLPVSNFVLLTDAHVEKGFDFFLKVAALLPAVPFLAVARRAQLAEAIAAANEFPNVAIVSHVEDMDLVYRAAYLVAVPSYRLAESHGRPCIHAQRHGKPVIGADRGEVPFVLDRSGIVLPEDERLWAAEIERLRTDDAYYREKVRAARENAARYSPRQQADSLRRLAAAAEAPILVGVGGGLGNMLHTTPMIRNIARRLGRPVDVVAAEDHNNSLCLMHNQASVGAVFALRQLVLARRYETVFLTHSFGPMRVAFNSDNVVWAADWREYRPIEEHETRYNLDAAKDLLKIPYREEDVLGYFCGDLEYRKPSGTLVGMHAGSKTGRWLEKRWPHFAELAARLRRRGIRVASFGTADEYVEGTENRTGATIEAMCESMLECSHFVSNDSGVMNIANALGIPMLALFAPTNVDARLPLRPTTSAIVLDKDCVPCELLDPETFQRGQCRCMTEIETDFVEENLIAMMRDEAAPERRIIAAEPARNY